MPIPDEMPLQGSFTVTQELRIDMESKRPEDFFYLIFD